MNTQPLLSVIIPVYNTAPYLEKCLDSVLSQTYQNIEIIAVNDGSTDNSRQIIEKYTQKDGRITLVSHDKNRGLFHARITGFNASTGDYIAHLDSDDYVSIDFYRSLVYGIQKTGSDMAMGDVVEEHDGGGRFIYNLADTDTSFDILEEEEILASFFGQKGLNRYWHVVWNKVYTRELWKKIIPYCLKQTKHLVLMEDMAFSTLLYFFTKKTTRLHGDCIFYCRHDNDNPATSMNSLGYRKQKKNIEDLTTSFMFVENFLREKEKFHKYADDFLFWRKNDTYRHRKHISSINCSLREKDDLYKELNVLCEDSTEIQNPDYFYSITTDWNSRYEEIKQAICNPHIKVVSFDIFDTLVVRPFLRPVDLFIMLDDDFRKLTGGKTVADFFTLRIESEIKAHEILSKNRPGLEDISLDEIYDALCSEYRIPKSIAERMKHLEIQAELKFCTARKAVFSLYEMASHIGKHIICISDMYLPMDVIRQILVKNGYSEISTIYVSSDTRAGKWGGMFPLVVSDLGVLPEEILHLGDNYDCDYVQAQKYGLSAVHFIKTQDAFFDPSICGNLGKIFLRQLPAWQDNRTSLNFFGIRIMIGLIVNYYFDNPYRSFNKSTDFNADPGLIGYGAVGMYLFGIVRWLIDNFKEKDYTKALFVARDGYLPMEAYKLLKPLYGEELPQEEYFYISRQAVMSIAIQDDLDIYKLHELSWPCNKTPYKIVQYLEKVFDIDRMRFEIVCNKNNIRPDENFRSIGDYHSFLNILMDNFFDREKHHERLEKLSRYFNGKLGENACIFDIGYSAKPEMYLSLLCKKNIDIYFVNIWNDLPFKHSQKSNCGLKIFSTCRPLLNGYIDELVLSKQAASCIGYEIQGDGVNPVFEDTKQSYQEQFVIDHIQKAALHFVKDVAGIFDNKIEKLWFQSYYSSMLFSLFFFSPKETDQRIFDCFIFEDDLGWGTKSVVNTWKQELEWAKQNFLMEMYPNPLQCESDQLQGELNALHASVSFRLGRKLTWFPRKARGFFRCIKENGVIYTMKHFFRKVILYITRNIKNRHKTR